MKDKINFNNLNQLIFYILPISIVLSNFLTNVVVIYLSIYGIYKIFELKEFKILNQTVIKVFILFCFFITINTLLIDPNFLSVKSSSSFIRYLFFVIGIYYIYRINNKLFYNFFLIYLAIFLFLLIDSNFQFYNKGINLFGFDSFFIQRNRVSSIFNEELILGSYIQKFTILAVCYFYSIHKTRSDFLILIILIISIQICFISGERAALFSILLFSIVYLFLFSNFPISRKLIIFLSSILIFSIFVSQNEPVKDRIFKATVSSVKSSNTLYFSPGHKKHLDNAIELFKNKPISGHGTNNFRIACKDVEEKLKINGCSTHPHNLIAQFISEKGLIGLLFLIFFYVYIFLSLLKFLTKFNINDSKKLAFLLFGVLIFYNPVFPSHNFYNSWVNNIIFIIFSFFLIKQSKINNA